MSDEFYDTSKRCYNLQANCYLIELDCRATARNDDHNVIAPLVGYSNFIAVIAVQVK